jgi:hypothetical protein
MLAQRQLFFSALVLVLAIGAPVAAQQVEMKKQFEGDVASSLSAINVVIAVEAPGLPSKSVAEIFSASADIARTLGLEPVKEERVASAIKAKGRAPSGEADARAMAELLESGRVLIIRAATADKDVELSVLGLNARSGVSAQETKVVARASVTAQCRAMVVDVLAAMAAPPPPPPSQPVKVVAPVAAPSIEPPPPPLVQVPPPVVAPAQKPRPARTTQPAARGAAIFGVTVGVQAVSMALCYALNAELEHDGRKTDFMDWALGYSLVVPILSGTAGWAVANARTSVKHNYGSILLGTYLGSAIAFGLGAASHYGLGERPSDSPFFWPATHVVLPLFLPAIGAAIFHRLGSREKQTDKTTADRGQKANGPVYFPPTVAVSSSSTQGDTVSVSLGTLSF